MVSFRLNLSIFESVAHASALPSTPTKNMGIISAAVETKRIVVMWTRRILVSMALCLILGFVGLVTHWLSAGAKMRLELELFLLLLQVCCELVTLVLTFLAAALQVPLSFAADAVRDAVWDVVWAPVWDVVWALLRWTFSFLSGAVW